MEHVNNQSGSISGGPRHVLGCLLLALSFVTAAESAAPAGTIQIEIKGHVTVNDQPYTGTGRFRFDLMDPSGAGVWSSGADKAIQVANGDYNTHLHIKLTGESNRIIPTGTALRIWFDDGAHGQRRLEPDVQMEQFLPSVVSTGENNDLQAQLNAIRAELAELKHAIRADTRLRAPVGGPTARAATPPPRHERVRLPVREFVQLGSPTAPVIMVEFMNYQCGYCRRYFREVFPLIKERYIDTGKVRYMVRHLNLPAFAEAGDAALATLCMERHDHFWEMHDYFSNNPEKLAAAHHREAVLAIGLDEEQSAACAGSPELAARLSEYRRDAEAVGITGAPSYVVGRVLTQGVLHGDRFVGFVSFETWQARLDPMVETVK